MPITNALTSVLTRGLTQDLFKNPPFTNAYSVLFDGTDDYAQTNAVSTRASKTYSFWAKSSDTARNDVFWHGAGDIGFFGFNFSGGRSVLYLGTGYFRYWDSTDDRADGN